MSIALFIAKRITLQSKRSFSRLVIGIAVAGIALGVAVMIVSMAVVTGFKTEIQHKITGFAGHIQVAALQVTNTYESAPIDSVEGIKRFITESVAVKNVQPYACKAGIISANQEIEGVVLKGVDSSYNWQYIENQLTAGVVPRYSNDSASTKIVVSAFIANRLNVKLHDKLLMYFMDYPIRKRRFEVVGIYDFGVQELDKLFVIGDIQQVQKLNNWTNTQIGGFEIELHDVEQMAQQTSYINEYLPETLVAQSATELYPMLFEWMALLDVNSEVIIVLMLLVAGINMISALLIMILERTNMIGLLKALGCNNNTLRAIFLYNAAWLIGVGMLIGNVLGVGLCFLQQQYQLITLDQQSYYMAYAPIQLDVMHLLLLNLGTLVVCVLMLLLPSMLVARILPIKAIRFK